MGLFKAKPPQPPPPLPPAPPPQEHPQSVAPLRTGPYRLPEATRWTTALERGLFELVEDEILEMDDLPHLNYILSIVCQHLPRLPALDAWVADGPTHAALLVRGAHGIRWAWQARGAGDAESVTEEANIVWTERLARAEADLHAAIALEPDNPAPWAELVISARATEVPQAERYVRYANATTGDRFMPACAAEMLQGLCKKWGGSHDAMFAFAAETAAAAPEGHPIHLVVPSAMIERHLACESLEEWQHLCATAPQWSEVLYAAAARSVDLPGFDDGGPTAMFARNMFAAAFARFDHQDRLRWELEKIGPDIGEWPWALWGGDKEVRRLRTLVGLP